ncbi:MAG: PqqD family protein [Ruminococcus sp.]|nr:PqqD family protein [Ruminococcus sp.]
MAFPHVTACLISLVGIILEVTVTYFLGGFLGGPYVNKLLSKTKPGKKVLEMKLNENFLTQEIDDTQVMVATGDTAFNGIVRSNQTAAEIVDLMKEETTRDAVVDKMCAKYDASRDEIAADVDMVIATLRKVGALDE